MLVDASEVRVGRRQCLDFAEQRFGEEALFDLKGPVWQRREWVFVGDAMRVLVRYGGRGADDAFEVHFAVVFHPDDFADFLGDDC